MLNKINMRNRLLILRASLFIIFLSLILPFSATLLEHMVHHGLKREAVQLVDELKQKDDQEMMVRYVFDNAEKFFFYISIIDDNYEVLYDNRTHPPYALDPFERDNLKVVFETGKSFQIGKPSQPWTYASVGFNLEDKKYVLMSSLTTDQLKNWVFHFRIVLFVVFSTFIFLYSIFLWWGGSRLLRPLLDITRAIRPYAMSKTDVLAPIPVQRAMSQECKHLAVTINSLLEKVKESGRLYAEERNEKETVFETLAEGVITLDAVGLVRFINHTAANMLAVPRRQMIGKNFMPPEPHPKMGLFKSCHAVARLALEQGHVVTDAISIGDIEKTHLDLIAIPKPFKTGVMLILQDKSSQHKVVEMGKDFISNASHELRTPITIIKGFAETLQDLPAVSPVMLTEVLEKIVRNCQRMDSVVKNLLTLADIEYVPESRFQACDVVTMADNCRHLLATLSPQTKIDLDHSHESISVEADPDLLELALMNLLENGIKYSKAPAHLTIFLKEQSGEILIAVQDRGIGIPKDDLPHIFERFYTVDKAHSRRLGGAGLGLSIVRTIIEKHEGTISVASVMGQGTTFTILLPQHRHAVT